RQLLQFALGGRQRTGRIAAGLLDQLRGHALLVVEERLQQVFGGDLLMMIAQRNGLGRLQEDLGAIGEFLKIHDLPSYRPSVAPRSRQRNTLRTRVFGSPPPRSKRPARAKSMGDRPRTRSAASRIREIRRTVTYSPAFAKARSPRPRRRRPW